MDTSKDCSKQLEMNSADMTDKDQKLANLAANCFSVVEKNQMQEQLNQLQEQLDQANHDKNTLEGEKVLEKNKKL